MAARATGAQDVRRRLLDAAAEVLAERGPAGLTVRAIAARAGVSVGLLYNYFADRDDLLVALTLDRFGQQAEAGRQLNDQAGTGSVQDNLVAFGSGMVSASTLELARLVLARPDLADRVSQALDTGAPGLDVIEQTLAGYLRAEQRLGRVHPGADPDAAAFLLVAAWHRLLQTSATADPPDGITRTVTAVLAGLTPLDPPAS